MSWIDIVWPMSGAASLTLGIIHLSIWLHRRNQWTHLAFSMAAFCVTAMVIVELLSFRVSSPGQYAELVRWGHVPFALTVVSLIAYVHLRFKESRPRLALLAAGARLAVLIPNFLTGQNLNFRSVESVIRVDVLGGQLTAPIGIPNPWMLLGQLSQLLLVIYLADVIIRAWREGGRERRMRASVVCGSILLFMLSNGMWSIMVVLGILHSPIIVNVSFVIVILVMSYELGGDVLRASLLSESLAGSQLQLRESERRLKLAATSGGLGLWSWKVSAGGTWLTDNGETLLGLAPGQEVNWTALRARVHPDDVPGMEIARDAAVNGLPCTCEFRVLQQDGSMRWFAASGRRELDDADERGIIRGVLQDVTERRLAEERFRLVVETAPDAILMIDVNGRIALANSRAERLLGYDRAELATLGVDQLMPPEFLGEHAGLRAAFAVAHAARGTATGRTLAAQPRVGEAAIPVEVLLTPLRMEGDAYTIASITDISERLTLEQQAATQRDELAHLSRVALLGELSGSLEHELNQPLTAILSNAQAALRFMQRQPADLAEVRQSLLHIVESDKRAGEVIRRLRSMMRKGAVTHESMDVNETVRESLQLLGADLLKRGVTVQLQTSPGLPAVVGDAVQIKQVMLNLVVNACDAMRERSNERLLGVRTFSRADETVEICVSDTGGGVAPEELERIFMPFVTTKPEGIGLGLAICRTLIQAHGGRLWASNNASGGATFHVLLAVNASEAGSPIDQAKKPETRSINQ